MKSEFKPRVAPSGSFQGMTVESGKKTTIQVLIGPEDAPNFAMRKFTMEPGGGMPKHTNAVEHEQYVLTGRAKVGIGEKVYSVEAGDVLLIPAGTPHWYRTEGDQPFEFLCVVPNISDRIEIIEDK